MATKFVAGMAAVAPLGALVLIELPAVAAKFVAERLGDLAVVKETEVVVEKDFDVWL